MMVYLLLFTYVVEASRNKMIPRTREETTNFTYNVCMYVSIKLREILSKIQTWSRASIFGAHSTFSTSKCLRMTAMLSITTPDPMVLRWQR